jgi:hypothetical protein
MNNIHIRGKWRAMMVIYVFWLIDWVLFERNLRQFEYEWMYYLEIDEVLIHYDMIVDFLIEDQVFLVLNQLIVVLYVRDPFLMHIFQFLSIVYTLQIVLEGFHIEY